jgi:hypothetical protein
MNELGKQFAKQAQWQTGRKALSWPEKVRQAEAIRDSIKTLRGEKPDLPPTQAAGVVADRTS